MLYLSIYKGRDLYNKKELVKVSRLVKALQPYAYVFSSSDEEIRVIIIRSFVG